MQTSSDVEKVVEDGEEDLKMLSFQLNEIKRRLKNLEIGIETLLKKRRKIENADQLFVFKLNICKICNKSFHSDYTLARHSFLHVDKSHFYICKECSDIFWHKIDIRRHEFKCQRPPARLSSL